MVRGQTLVPRERGRHSQDCRGLHRGPARSRVTFPLLTAFLCLYPLYTSGTPILFTILYKRSRRNGPGLRFL
jgi:hypothetical protein